MAVVAHRYRFTVDQYHRMGDVGIFDRDCRVELINGEIFEMSPINPWHAGVVDFLGNRLTIGLVGRAIARIQNPTEIDPRSEPQPDVMLLKPRRDFYRTAHPRPGDTLLVIEVADASLRHDRGRKLRAYARAGVPEVWIVSRPGDAIEVFREPSKHGYREHQTLRRGERLAPAAFPDLTLSVEDILG